MKQVARLTAILAALISVMNWPDGRAQSRVAGTVPARAECQFSGMPVNKGQSPAGSGQVMKESVRRIYLMGTYCTLHFYSHDAKEALRQIESFIIRMERTEEELSTWKETSALSRLNRQSVGIPFRIDRSLGRLFRELKYWSEATGGAFDPSVGRLLSAYGLKTGGKWPDPKKLEAAVLDRGMKFYALDKSERCITKTRDIQIDCGAFGKGEALDRLPKGDGTDGAWLVDLGGQIMVHGAPAGNDGWPVDISHPQNRQESLLTVKLRSGSLATSGGSERDLEIDKRRLGHILNPDTGRPSEFRGSASVWHQQALVADILSTALYVMGPEKGLAWAESRQIAACFLVPGENGRVTVVPSSAFAEKFLQPAP